MGLWGDQWICQCGWHNFIERKKCRNCGRPKEEAVGEESWLEVMDRVTYEGLAKMAVEEAERIISKSAKKNNNQ